MFVQTNSVQAIKHYFRDRLKDHFSESEIRSITKEAVIDRLKISASDYLLADGNLLSESDLLFFRSIVKRLLNNEPFQYVLGRTEFFGLSIQTDKRALIPRPETEELVQWVTELYNKEQEINVVDLCTGSGCIALALKSTFKNANVEATDFSNEALNLANENKDHLNLDIQLVHFNALESKGYDNLKYQEYDCWVSNPPYIPFKDEVHMKENVLAFEPHMALFVENDDPLIFYREIGKNALNKLKKGGRLFFELHEDLGKQTIQLLEEIGFVNIELRKDLQGKDRMLMGQKP